MGNLILNVDRVRLFKRRDSCFWQARIVLAGEIHRRSTFCRKKRDAKPIAERWRLQLLRRGKPAPHHQPECLADTL